MKKFLKYLINSFGFQLKRSRGMESSKYDSIYHKYSEFTMMPKDLYKENIELCEKFSFLKGNIVECGVWRGGMMAGMTEVLGKNRKYILCDSFEGLPKATEKDGQSAIDWQSNKTGTTYFDNCLAEESYARSLMENLNVDFELVKGWFSETLPKLNCGSIAILRLDADWYDSMYCCLEYLYPYVINNGIIIIDDYFVWDGCSKAVHAYLSLTSSRIFQTSMGVTYIVKND